MEVLRLAKKVLRFTTFYWNRGDSYQFKTLAWTILLFMLVLMQFVFWPGLILVLRLMRSDHPQSAQRMLYVIAQMVSATVKVCSVVALLFRKTEIRNLFDMIEHTVDSSETLVVRWATRMHTILIKLLLTFSQD